MSNISEPVAQAALSEIALLQKQIAALQAADKTAGDATDVLHLLTMGIFVVVMQVGFLLFEAGCVRKKNLTNIAMKNLGDMGACGLGYFVMGYAFGFGNGNGFSGRDYFVLHELPPLLMAKVFFQCSFAMASTTILSGAISERTRYPMYLIYAFLMGAFIYPFTTHWVWAPEGFLRRLGEFGVVDFAGGGPVHLLGGCVSLAGAKIIGARLRGSQATLSNLSTDSSTVSLGDLGQIEVSTRGTGGSGSGGATPNVTVNETRDGATSAMGGSASASGEHAQVQRERTERQGSMTSSANSETARELRKRIQEVEEYMRRSVLGLEPIPGHKPLYLILGTMFLAIGWFGFNAGSTGGLSGADLHLVSARVAVVSLIALSSGMMTGVLFSAVFGKVGQYDVMDTCAGALGGLVAITPGCATTEPLVAVFVGAVGSLVANFGPRLVVRMGVDDPVGAIALHGFCGIWGLFACGLFTRRDYAMQVYAHRDISHGYGLFYGGGAELLGIQLLEIVVIAAWGLVLGSVLFLILRRFNMRVSARDEIIGLDVCEHNQAVHDEIRTLERSEAKRRERHEVVAQVARRIELKTQERNIDRSHKLFSGGNNIEIVAVVGESGSGRTTHARLLADRTGATYLSIIDLLQRSAKHHTGQERILELINSKRIVPPTMICINLLKTAINGTGKALPLPGARVAPSELASSSRTNASSAAGGSSSAPRTAFEGGEAQAQETPAPVNARGKRAYVIDGFPRDLEQMLALQNEFGQDVIVIWLENAEKTSLKSPALENAFVSFLQRKKALVKVMLSRSQPIETNFDMLFNSYTKHVAANAPQSAPVQERQLAPWEA